MYDRVIRKDYHERDLYYGTWGDAGHYDGHCSLQEKDMILSEAEPYGRKECRCFIDRGHRKLQELTFAGQSEY